MCHVDVPCWVVCPLSPCYDVLTMLAYGLDMVGVHPLSASRAFFIGSDTLLALSSCPIVVQVPGISPIVDGVSVVFLSPVVRVFLVGCCALLALIIEFLLSSLVGLPPRVGPPHHSHVGLPLLVGPPHAFGSVVAC